MVDLNPGYRVSQSCLQETERREAETGNRKWQVSEWELFEGPLETQSSGLGSFENASKGILWGRVSETLNPGSAREGLIRCADSLAMFLGQEATALTMKNMKVLKEDPHCPGTKREALLVLRELNDSEAWL